MGRVENNGRSWTIVWWIVGALFAIVLAGGSAWLTSIHASVSDIQTTVGQRSERLSVVEERQRSYDADLQEIRIELRTINGKLDRALRR